MNDANFDIVEKLEAFVKARGHTMLELAFSWLAARPTRRQHHRGRDQARADRGERQGGGLGARRAEDMAEIDKITARSEICSRGYPLRARRGVDLLARSAGMDRKSVNQCRRAMATYPGACFCGPVHSQFTGEPEGTGYCRCSSCRSWSAGPVNAFTRLEA